jgi:hypothetical protein
VVVANDAETPPKDGDQPQVVEDPGANYDDDDEEEEVEVDEEVDAKAKKGKADPK